MNHVMGTARCLPGGSHRLPAEAEATRPSRYGETGSFKWVASGFSRKEVRRRLSTPDQRRTTTGNSDAGACQHRRRNRPRHEHRPRSLRRRERASEVLLGHRAEESHQSLQAPAESASPASECPAPPMTYSNPTSKSERLTLYADAGQDQYSGVKVWPRNLQQPDPQADEWKIQDQQHHVADVEAGDEAPDQLHVAGEQQRSRLAVLLKRGQQDCGGREVGRPSVRSGTSVPAAAALAASAGRHAFDRSPAKTLRLACEAALERRRKKRRDLRPAGRQHAAGKSQRSPAQPGTPRA